MKKNKIRSNIIKSLFVVIITIVFINFISIKSDNAFNIIGFRTYTVLSGSMKPKINPGDIVVVTNKANNKLKKDDIITFKEENDVITHRIIDIKDNGYITKGDNNNSIDSFIVYPENVIGKVLFHIPKIGYIVEFLARPIVISIEMILLAILIIKSVIKDKN